MDEPETKSAVARHFSKIEDVGFIPKDEYGHGVYMIKPDKEDVNTFQQILQKQILLANIGDDTMLRYYQNDIVNLTSLFGMQKRDPSLRQLFLELYYGWLNELGLTRTKDGMERKMQASVGKYNLQEILKGYGIDLPHLQGQQEDELNQLAKLLGKK